MSSENDPCLRSIMSHSDFLEAMLPECNRMIRAATMTTVLTIRNQTFDVSVVEQVHSGLVYWVNDGDSVFLTAFQDCLFGSFWKNVVVTEEKRLECGIGHDYAGLK